MNTNINNYALVILIGTTHTPAEDTYSDARVVYDMFAACQAITEFGTPQKILVAAETSLSDHLTRQHIGVFLNALRDNLRDAERRYCMLERKLSVDVIHQESDTEAARLKHGLLQIAEEYLPEQVMLRRHRKVMKKMAPNFQQFMRTGYWGNCVSCPVVYNPDGLTSMQLAEHCEYKDRHDHRLSHRSLFERYNDEMTEPRGN